jgi:hypothetical protein
LLSVCQIIEQAFEYTFKLPKNEELVFDIGDLARAEALHQADTLTRLVQNGIIKPNEARARLELAPIPGVADELVSQMQIQPMQQNADIAQRAADREDEIAASKLELANKKPDLDPNGGIADQLLQRIGTSSTPTGPDTEQSVAEQLKERLNKQVDIESLELMLKGVFR